jgi:hypothetical protein
MGACSEKILKLLRLTPKAKGQALEHFYDIFMIRMLVFEQMSKELDKSW